MTGFVMSDRTRAAMNAALEPLTVEQRAKALDAIATLSTEISLHIRKVTTEEVLENLRQQWSDVLQTMHLRTK